MAKGLKPKIDKYLILSVFCVFFFIFSFFGISILSTGTNDLCFGYADADVQECGCSKCHTVELDGCSGCHYSNKSQHKSIDTQTNSMDSNDLGLNAEVEDDTPSEPESVDQPSHNSKASNPGSELNKRPRK